MNSFATTTAVILALTAIGSCTPWHTYARNVLMQSSSKQCGIPKGPDLAAGQVWVNELCSILTIKSYDCNSGLFTGTHKNIRGVAKGDFAVAGYKDPKGNTLGWTLNWKNAVLDACTVITWSGQTQILPNGDEVILTTWVVTRETRFEDNWTSTLIGSDQFYPIDKSPFSCKAIINSFFYSK